MKNARHPKADAERHEDALQPAFYRHLQHVWRYDAIVSELWSQLVDLALPLAINFAPIVRFFVHTEHLSKAHDLRRRYLNALAGLGRIVFLVTSPGLIAAFGEPIK